MKTHHTPVWHTASTGNHQGLIVDDAGNNIAVAYDKANAPLIAAAPELLKALEDAHALLHGPVSDVLTGDQLAESGAYRVMEAMRAVLAKTAPPENPNAGAVAPHGTPKGRWTP